MRVPGCGEGRSKHGKIDPIPGRVHKKAIWAPPFKTQILGCVRCVLGNTNDAEDLHVHSGVRVYMQIWG